MSDITNLDQLGARALTALLRGCYFQFWGLLVLLASLAEALITPTLRPLSVVLICGGALGMVVGAGQFVRVNGLGNSWRRRTRELLVVAAAAAYLSLFFIMWRQRSSNSYLLAHGLLFLGAVVALLCLICLPVAELARLAGRTSLAIQSVAFGTVAIVLLVPPFGYVVLSLLPAIRQHGDTFGILQWWVTGAPQWLLLLLLAPASLTLSLLWTTKDLVLEYLAADRLNPHT